MTNIAQIVKQIAVSAKDRTVVIELICSDAYGAEVLREDITSRLVNDRVLSVIVKVGATVESGAAT